MRAILRRDCQILCSAFLLAVAGVTSSCGQPPYAVSSPNSSALGQVEEPGPVTADEAPVAAEDTAPTVNPIKPGLLPPVKPNVPGKPGLGMPDPDTGTYLTPQARANKKRGKHMWNPEWDAIIQAALPPRMLSNEVPTDVTAACPRFFQLSTDQMKTFWAYFFQALAVPESGFDHKQRYVERKIQGVDRVTRKSIVSEGLLQLSYQDAPYHGCEFDYKADQALTDKSKVKTIHDPKRNLECGVKIFYKQLFGAKTPRSVFTSGKFYYWSVLVRGSSGHTAVMKQLRGVPAFCKQAE